ncbi:hypothetical protein ACIQLJ_04870 [Microbacterium sp. NPDC091313]
MPGVVVRDATWRERRGLSRSDRHGAVAVSIPTVGLFVLPAADLRRTIETPLRVAGDAGGETSLWLAGYEAYITTDPTVDAAALLRLRDDERSRSR